MSTNGRAPSSQFYWRDWLADPAVQSMSFEEQGRYIRVLAMTHQTDHPGVCKEEDIRRWACYEAEEWAGHREAFARAFRIRSDGTWIQKRTVEEREAQRRRFERAQEGGRRSATRARDSLGHLAPRLGGHLEAGLGTRSFSPASSELMNPTPPHPASVPILASTCMSAAVAGDAQGNQSTEREKGGLEPVGDVLQRAIPKLGVGGRHSPLPGYAGVFARRMRARFPDIDLFAVAAWVREEAKAGRVKDPEGLFVWRCEQLLAGSSPSRNGAPAA